jgi:hypothetical protein
LKTQSGHQRVVRHGHLPDGRQWERTRPLRRLRRKRRPRSRICRQL